MTKGTARTLSTASHFTSVFMTATICMIAAVFIICFLLNIKMFAVQSGSMSPKYPVGSVVCVKEVEFSELEVGDVITFVASEDGTLVTHRIVAIDTANMQVTTKGDANAIQDGSPVVAGNIVGKVKFGIPLLGGLLSFVIDKAHRVLVFGILIAIGIISYLLDRLDKKCLEIESKQEEENGRPKDEKDEKLSNIHGNGMRHMHHAHKRNNGISSVNQRNSGERVRARSNTNQHGRGESRRSRRGSR